MRVGDIASRPLIAAGPGASAADVGALMRDRDVGCVVLLDQGRLAGLVTDRDLAVTAVAAGRDPRATPVSDLGSRAVVTCPEDADLAEAIRLMRVHQVRRLVVVAPEGPVALVAVSDLARAAEGERELEDVCLLLADISSGRVALPPSEMPPSPGAGR